MSDIEVTVNQDQWNALAKLAVRLDNMEIDEDEYAESLLQIIGPSVRTRLGDGDKLHIILKPKVQVHVRRPPH